MPNHRKPLTQRLHEYTKRKRNGCIIWTGLTTKRGYPRTSPLAIFSVKYERVTRLLLAKRFGRDLRGDEFAMHVCDNPSCIRIHRKHVVLGNATLNNRDTVTKGRRGIRKLDAAAMRRIRALYECGHLSQTVIAAMFGVNQTRISQITRD